MVKKILITGGAGGIAQQTIKALKQKNEDYNFILIDNNDKRLEEADEQADKQNIDVRDYEELQRLAEKTEIDILFNCAGIQKQAAIEDAEIGEFREHMQHNYLGTVNAVKAFLPQLKEKEEAKIINVSSVAGFTGLPFLGGYCASKYAVEGFTDTLRRELYDQDVQVVLVEPGRVKTGFNEEGVENMRKYLEESEWSEEYQEKLNEESYGGIESQKAGKKLAKIINKPENKPRYIINNEAIVLKLMKALLPARIYDRVINRVL